MHNKGCMRQRTSTSSLWDALIKQRLRWRSISIISAGADRTGALDRVSLTLLLWVCVFSNKHRVEGVYFYLLSTLSAFFFFSLPHLRYAHKDTHFLFSVHRCPSQQKQKREWLSLACVAVEPCKSFLLLLTENHTHKDGPFDWVKNAAAKRAKNWACSCDSRFPSLFNYTTLRLVFAHVPLLLLAWWNYIRVICMSTTHYFC